MDTRESAAFEDRSAALALHEGEPRQRDHQRREIERVGDEFRGQLERRVHHDAFAAIRRLALHQEVAAVEVRRVAVVHEVAADHLVTGGAQHVDDVAGAAARIPQSMGQPLVPQQRFDRDRRRLIQIIPALAQRVPPYLARGVEHQRRPPS